VPLILFHTRKVREAPAALGTDLFFVLLIASFIAGAIMIGKQAAARAADLLRKTTPTARRCRPFF